MDDYAGPAPEVANRLLLSTITAGDAKINFEPALTRVKYDLEDIDAQIKCCVEENTPELIQSVESVSKCKKLVSELEPDVENISSEFETLESDFLRPYARLQRAYGAAKRLHQTSELVRGCNWYLRAAREYEVLAETNVYGAAAQLEKLRQILESNVHLQSLAAVRKHAATLDSERRKLAVRAMETIKGYNGGRQELRSAVLGLCILDKDQLLGATEAWVKAQAASTVLGVTRGVGNSTAFDSAWGQAEDRSANVGHISELLGQCFMLTRAENRLGGPLVTAFWQLVATNIGQKLYTMSVANPSQSRAMKAQAEHIQEKVKGVEVVSAVFKKHF